jgi:hypothetical protein
MKPRGRRPSPADGLRGGYRTGSVVLPVVVVVAAPGIIPIRSAGGMLATARNLGMVVGVPVASALFRARAGEVAGAPARFLAGYRAALLTGAAFALAAGVVVLARDGKGRAGEDPVVEGEGMRG